MYKIIAQFLLEFADNNRPCLELKLMRVIRIRKIERANLDSQEAVALVPATITAVDENHVPLLSFDELDRLLPYIINAVRLELIDKNAANRRILNLADEKLIVVGADGESDAYLRFEGLDQGDKDLELRHLNFIKVACYNYLSQALAVPIFKRKNQNFDYTQSIFFQVFTENNQNKMRVRYLPLVANCDHDANESRDGSSTLIDYIPLGKDGAPMEDDTEGEGNTFDGAITSLLGTYYPDAVDKYERPTAEHLDDLPTPHPRAL